MLQREEDRAPRCAIPPSQTPTAKHHPDQVITRMSRPHRQRIPEREPRHPPSRAREVLERGWQPRLLLRHPQPPAAAPASWRRRAAVGRGRNRSGQRAEFSWEQKCRDLSGSCCWPLLRSDNEPDRDRDCRLASSPVLAGQMGSVIGWGSTLLRFADRESEERRQVAPEAVPVSAVSGSRSRRRARCCFRRSWAGWRSSLRLARFGGLLWWRGRQYASATAGLAHQSPRAALSARLRALLRRGRRRAGSGCLRRWSRRSPGAGRCGASRCRAGA